jgi:uncharacterized protein HemX
MTSRKAKKLLKKYWEEESTLDEEKQLKTFFHTHQRDSLPPDLRQAAELFSFFAKESERTMDDIPFPKALENSEKRTSILLKSWWKYAAVFILLLAGLLSYRFAKQQSSTNASAQPYTHQETTRAFKTTQKALQLIAGNLKMGKKEMQKLALFDEVQQQIAGNQPSLKH